MNTEILKTMYKKTYKLSGGYEAFHFGLDHLEVYGKLSSDFDMSYFNTHDSIEIGDNYIVKYYESIPGYEYKLVFHDNILGSKPVLFDFYKGSLLGNGAVPTRDYICFHSLMFRLHGESGVKDALVKLFTLSDRAPIKRFDLCLDIEAPFDTIKDSFKELKQKGALFYGVGGSTETFYIGETQNTLNKRSIIRVYNKVHDLIANAKKREKVKYYEDYMIRDYVTRVELEVRRELSQNLDIQNLFTKEMQESIFRNYLEHHTSIFANISDTKTSLYIARKKTDVTDAMPHLDKLRYIQSFKGYAKGIAEGMQMCPVKILLLEGYVHSDTLDKLNLLGTEKFMEVLKRNEYWRNEIFTSFNNSEEDAHD